MNLNAFSVFLTVVEEMNFTRAAERLYISQQALSGYIKRLEDHYGVALFQRKPTLKLTAEGEAMVVCAHQILESEHALARRFAGITLNATAVLTFGINDQRSSVFLPGIWKQFHSMHPNIIVRTHEHSTQKLLDELQSNQIDIMVGLEIVMTPNLTILPLAEEYMHCVLSEGLLKQYFPDNWQELLDGFRKEGVELSQLLDLPVLLLPEGSRSRFAVDRIFRKNHVLPKLALECSRQMVLFQAACCGSGVAIINPSSIYQEYRSRQLLPAGCYSFPLRDTPANQVSLAFRNDIPQPQYVLDLASCIQEEFREYNDLLTQHRL